MTNNEILLMADVVSREKGLEKEQIFQAIEAALATATRKRYQKDISVRVSIERDTGHYQPFQQWEVVEGEDDLEHPEKQLTLSVARESNPELEVGDILEEAMENEPTEFGRIAIQAAKQVIMQKVREAERHAIIQEFTSKIGELALGTVRRTDRDGLTIEINGVEGFLPRSNMIPRENLRKNDRVRVLIVDVAYQIKGPLIRLDRISPKFLVELFKLEVPEVGEGIIEVKSAARDPGVRCKIAVLSHDRQIDPIGACVGIRGARVQSVSNEIGGERVDIVLWSDDMAQLVINALSPAEVESIIIDEDKKSVDVVVDELQLSQAIGRGGQNVRLVAELVKWSINIMTDDQANKKSEDEENKTIKEFVEQLEIDEDIAQILVSNNFSTLEEIAYVPKQELLNIDEFDEEIVNELRNRAEDAILIKSIAMATGNEFPQELSDIKDITEEMIERLIANDVNAVDDLAELATDELLEIITEINEDQAKEMIMHARASWFAED